ncbi:MAG: 2,3-bisphosphoglycerate-independent phosphoglycerate mutase [Rickettsiales bacterium]|jgi:2,3-bisphosphoglycerate-independent phosphoglycerate mutase|nr:2,3-bisphosphoglycerate-independent phosphoglycerate mutase [Rickettsiales bacterium]
MKKEIKSRAASIRNSGPLVLCILDGVGHGVRPWGNAVWSAEMPFFRGLKKKYPHMLLNASGASVGLPPNTMGNSEVGHMTLGAGRPINQFLRRFQLEDLNENAPLNKFIKSLLRAKGAAHIVGLCSDGRVHSDLGDALKVAKILVKKGVKIIWHFVADGRDTEPRSALKYVGRIKHALGRNVAFGSVAGRYYTFDRDNNLERTRRGFDVVMGKAPAAINTCIEKEIGKNYKEGIFDEFIRPARFPGYSKPFGKNDGILFFNYRADRARQILHMFLDAGIKRILCFSGYGAGLDDKCPAMIPNAETKNTLGEILAKNNVSQLRLAETEKFNHVTYFFDAEHGSDHPNSEKILVQSPKVATFDLKPEMAAAEIAEKFVENAAKYKVVIMNFANGDMVGHTGNKKAAVMAMETLDKMLSIVVPKTLELGGTILITADHGNAEEMTDWLGREWKAHTTNPVPFIFVAANAPELKRVKDAGIANIAPTMLKILGIKPPKQMLEPLI